jgi:aryl-alcohol dehydrogenase-like predicted oxidoreductase
VASVVVGARSADQARANAAAGDVVLPAEASRRLDEITRPLKEKLGPNADLWQTRSRIR